MLFKEGLCFNRKRPKDPVEGGFAVKLIRSWREWLLWTKYGCMFWDSLTKLQSCQSKRQLSPLTLKLMYQRQSANTPVWFLRHRDVVMGHAVPKGQTFNRPTIQRYSELRFNFYKSLCQWSESRVLVWTSDDKGTFYVYTCRY